MIRGTPLLVQLFIIFYALPQFGIVIDPFPSAVIAFSLNVGGYAAEVIRAAILCIPQGQWEAAQTIGMNYPTTLRRIILPQAARTAVPPLSNTLISLVKDTSLASTILVTELLRVAQLAAAPTFEFFALYGVAAIYYWVICVILSFFQGRLETRLGRYVAPMTDLLTVRDVRKAFGDHEVLRGISFDVPAGTVTAVIGPSGSGKTTVLRSLNALDQADAGVITIGDVSVDFAADPDRAILDALPRPERDGLPEPQPVPAHDGAAERHRGPGRGAAAAEGRGPRGGAGACWRRSASRRRRTSTPTSSRAASSSASASPARWRCGPS